MMATSDQNEGMEYAALMARGRDAERTWQICWTASGLAAAVTLSWAVAARNAGLTLPAVIAVAYGFYSMLHGRRQTRLIAGYVEEHLETPEGGAQWFTRLRQLQSVPGFSPSGDWLVTCLSNVIVALAVVFSWMFASATTRGELMAGIVTGCGLIFAFHSVSETAQMLRTDCGAMWGHVGSGPTELRQGKRLLSR